MIQIGHRESHDIDIFLDDPQLLGFMDPSKSELRLEMMPSAYQKDGSKFQNSLSSMWVRPTSSLPEH
nr:hypothetical protein [Mesorhizobium sp.]